MSKSIIKRILDDMHEHTHIRAMVYIAMHLVLYFVFMQLLAGVIENRPHKEVAFGISQQYLQYLFSGLSISVSILYVVLKRAKFVPLIVASLIYCYYSMEPAYLYPYLSTIITGTGFLIFFFIWWLDQAIVRRNNVE